MNERHEFYSAWYVEFVEFVEFVKVVVDARIIDAAWGGAEK